MQDFNKHLNRMIMNTWLIDSFVGSGQSGYVYKAYDSKRNPVAVKIISIPNEQQVKECEIAFGGDREQIESLYDEIANRYVSEVESLRLLSDVNSGGGNNIIHYINHTASKQDSQWEIIIVMEFVNSLKDYFSRNKLSINTAIKLGVDIASGIERCQELNVIHRDIKDDNIFADDNGTFKIGDFGVANMSSATKASTKVGTPYYMAPEIQNGSEYDSSVDIYSLGIILYRLFNYSRFPFVPSYEQKPKLGMTDNEDAFKVRMSGAQMPPPLYCPPVLAQVILKACAFNPSDRYHSAAEFKEALINAANLISPEERAQLLPSTTYRYNPNMQYVNQGNNVTSVGPNSYQVPQSGIQQPGDINSTQLDPRDNNGGKPLAHTIDFTDQDTVSRLTEDMEQDEPELGVLGKTVDFLSSLIGKGNYDAAKRVSDIVRQRDEARNESERAKHKNRRLRNIIIGVAAFALLAVAAGVLLWPQTYTYSANASDNYYLYRCQFGDYKKVITNDEYPDGIPASYVVYDRTWIYFCLHDKAFEDDGDHRMFKVKKDGSEMTQITDDHCEYLVLYGEYIYYLSQRDNNALYRISTDGTGRELIVDGYIKSLSLSSDEGVLTVTYGEEKSAIEGIRGLRISNLGATDFSEMRTETME